jgi:DDE family transposase
LGITGSRHGATLNTAPGRRGHHSVGFDLDERARTAKHAASKAAWSHVPNTDGTPLDLEDAGVVELTSLPREHRKTGSKADPDALKGWPDDMRIIVRHERPHAGAQLSPFEEADGRRYQLLATNTPLRNPGRRRQIAFLEARHRPHARVEDRIRTGKATGLGHLPSKSFDLNRAWLLAVRMACDLPARLRRRCLSGSLATAEPRTLRDRLLHTAAHLVRDQGRRTIRIPKTWPWTWTNDFHPCLTAALTCRNPPVLHPHPSRRPRNRPWNDTTDVTVGHHHTPTPTTGSEDQQLPTTEAGSPQARMIRVSRPTSRKSPSVDGLRPGQSGGWARDDH